MWTFAVKKIVFSDVMNFMRHLPMKRMVHPRKNRFPVLPFIEDVNKDPVVVFDGLTKGFRYPGWRAAWMVGPKYLIEMVTELPALLTAVRRRSFRERQLKSFLPDTQKLNCLPQEKNLQLNAGS